MWKDRKLHLNKSNQSENSKVTIYLPRVAANVAAQFSPFCVLYLCGSQATSTQDRHMPSRWELSAQEHPRHHAVMADHMPRLFFQMLEGSR